MFSVERFESVYTESDIEKRCIKDMVTLWFSYMVNSASIQLTASRPKYLRTFMLVVEYFHFEQSKFSPFASIGMVKFFFVGEGGA